MYTTLLSLLLLPLSVYAQTSGAPSGSGTNSANPSSVTPAPSNNSASASQAQAAPANTTVVITSVDSVVSFLPGRVQTTVLVTHLSTTVMPVTTATPNTTDAAPSNSVSTTITPSNLPTANPSVDGGGQGGAPSPGAKSQGGAFGPDDNYIAAATALAKNAIMVSIVGSLVGGAMVLV